MGVGGWGPTTNIYATCSCLGLPCSSTPCVTAGANQTIQTIQTGLAWDEVRYPVAISCLLMQGSSGCKLFLERPGSHWHTADAGSEAVLLVGQGMQVLRLLNWSRRAGRYQESRLSGRGVCVGVWVHECVCGMQWDGVCVCVCVGVGVCVCGCVWVCGWVCACMCWEKVETID